LESTEQEPPLSPFPLFSSSATAIIIIIVTSIVLTGITVGSAAQLSWFDNGGKAGKRIID
jgi:hypothetical protein